MILQLVAVNGTVHWAKHIDIMNLKIDVIELGELLDKFVRDLKNLEISNG